MLRTITRYVAASFIIAYCLLPLTGYTQLWDYASMKEKVYLHANHVYFKPGETVFFKCYLVDARTQKPSFLSKTIYVEVINPAGSIAQKMTLPVTDGYAEGAWNFDSTAKGGIYKLRAYTTWMRNEEERTIFTKEIYLQKLIAPRILMKLDFAAKGYGAGDEAVADFSMRNLKDQPIGAHDIAYTVAIGGQTVSTSHLKTDAQGQAKIRFRLPQDLAVNDGLLNVTVQYNAYTESVSRSIPIVLNKIDLQFLPESGNMVVGLPAIIAFKAVDEYGKGADVKGNIVDQSGNIVTAFESYHRGMGKCFFMPQPGASYRAVITTPAGIRESYTLPEALPSGLVMNILKTKYTVQVNLQSSKVQMVSLSAYSRDSLYYSQDLYVKGRSTVEIDQAVFPAGITRFEVKDRRDQSLQERLVFMHENKGLQISLHPNKQLYGPREKVLLKIKTTDVNDRPIASNISLAVVDDKLWTLANDKQHNILSWLLMSSELAGTIEEPLFYFDINEPKASMALDLVMMTHGYRYFDYVKEVQETKKVKYLFDQGHVISGVVLDKGGKPLQTAVYLVRQGGPQELIQSSTRPDGSFQFTNLLPRTEYSLLAKPVEKMGKPFIIVHRNGIGHTPIQQQNTFLRREDRNLLPGAAVTDEPLVGEVKQLLSATENVQVMELDQKLMTSSNLNDVVVVGYGAISQRMLSTSLLRINSMELYGPIYNALQGRVPGLIVTPQFNEADKLRISVRGMGSLTGSQPPLMIMDGVPVEDFRLQSINPSEISSVTVFKDAAAIALYGAQGANGVIVIETRKSGIESIVVDVTNWYAFGMVSIKPLEATRPVVRKFYAPQYVTTHTDVRDDFRETIYWNGVVQTNGKGEAEVTFYNSDATTTFRTIAEGIGYNGLAGRKEHTYAVSEPLSVDIKIPPYFTVGDKALLPLVITNNSGADMQVTIDLGMPKGLLLQPFDCIASIGKDSARQILVPVIASDKAQGLIRVVVEGNGHKQILSWPVQVNPQGFPVSLVFSGDKTTEHTFPIASPVPFSYRTNLKLFREIDEQLMDGIESMIREPYGCFEQTSSTVYPNMLVIKYLRSKGMASAELEARAMKYLRSGYKRLLSFETPKGGFEWFGHAPGHLGLTAYGLLEFTDMKAFIEVDEKMLERTKVFLLQHRDTLAGFKHSSQGYDSFAGMYKDVGNCYVVYAMAKAGYGQEVFPQYQAAVQRALTLRDGYMVAMMANAAIAMKQQHDYRQLISLANKLYEENRLKANTSMVGSYGESLKVETYSLYALALMHDKFSELPTLYGVLSEILKRKSYYGFGSTQGTVLALQALVSYHEFRKRADNETKVHITLNKQTVVPGTMSPLLLRAGKNEFSVKYSDDSSYIPYQFEVNYHTHIPPSNEKTAVKLSTQLADTIVRVGQTVRMEIAVTNKEQYALPMTIAKIGIPAGLTVQPWQLKEILEKNQVAYYELFDNWLVFYWTSFDGNETKTINLDLKAEIGGSYKAKASNAYQYYTPEEKHWVEGSAVTVEP
ncbi:TonB-dependent receptor plug domain-containing protein [Paraflavitalea sp. CAU 1676]|uniref:TonB-dependent receptor plug domain-containing protein n=1 Tax=Paraflavitalea sp. CAU 1676 TaxID=3032598 RepID=UPI0023DBE4BD|nr:TonB-dependent receptor plug domain-containing protein [Paraflavitalea sp. CAU 1676]MDF2193651.1 TonB-dependent receptor plug domain-containing protein [Paraflavitalea sp. CAU 1676]